MKKFYWICAVIVTVSVLYLVGFSVRNSMTSQMQENQLPKGVITLPPRTLRKHSIEMAKAFKQADIIELYGIDFKGRSPELAQKVGEIRKDHDPQSWQELTDAVARASSGEEAKAIWQMAFVLRRDGREIALGHFLARDGELAMRIKGRDYGRVWAGEAFRQTLRPFEEKYLETQLPRVDKQQEVLAADKPIEFQLLKAHLVELFEKAGYANIAKPSWSQGVEGVETIGRHAKAWQLMTKGVRRGSEGYSLTKWPPEVWIWPILESKPQWVTSDDFELLYTNGILYSRAKEFGGMVQTIKPSAEFDIGLNMIVASLEPAALGKGDVEDQNRGGTGDD